MRRKVHVVKSKATGVMMWGFIGLWLFFFGQFSTALGKEVEELIQIIDQQQRKIQTITATFSQTKEVSLVKTPLLSSGLVKFKRPAQIYWHYSKPEPMEVALDGKTIWMYSPGSAQAEKYSFGRSTRMAQSLEPLLAIFQKTLGQLTETYTIFYEGLEADRLHRFHLQPREQKVQKFLSRLDLWVDKISGAIIRFKMVEANGDRLTLEFKNLQINPPLTDDDLKIKIPPSVRVQDQSMP